MVTAPAPEVPRQSVVLVALLICAWLLPNHYPPWTAFHSDFVAAIALSISAVWLFGSGEKIQSVPAHALLIAGLALVPLVQAALGLIHFAGDAWLASIYLFGLAFAVVSGYLLHGRSEQVIVVLAWGVLASALVSVGLAMAQWFGVSIESILAMEMRPGGRPYANFAQPNQLATFLMLGLVFALLLHQCGRLGNAVLALVVTVLGVGIALTQSRAAWVEIVVLVAFVVTMKDRAGLRLPRAACVALAVPVLSTSLALTTLRDALMLAPATRGLAEQASGGTRPIHWATAADAIAREPLFGYGWNQLSVAVGRVAPDHAASGEMIEHSHNLLLDLLAWNGVPFGLLIILGITLWMARHIRAARDGSSALLIAALGVTVVHSMFEFPLEYAYVLIPIGFIAGALEARNRKAPVVQVPKLWLLAGAIACTAVTGQIGREYFAIEEHHRVLRFESANIGQPPAKSFEPNVLILTQLQAFQRFARTEATPQMSAEALDGMRKVSERYGYPPVLFRYALAAALNGDSLASAHALKRICKQHPPPLCAEAKQNWATLQSGAYPQLARVPYPPIELGR